MFQVNFIPSLAPNWKTTVWFFAMLKAIFPFAFSLRSKRFCAVREQRITGRWMEWVKEGKGKGEGREEGNACRQTPGFWKPPTRKQRCHAVINKPIKSSAFRRGSELWTKTNLQSKQVKRSSHECINKFFIANLISVIISIIRSSDE